MKGEPELQTINRGDGGLWFDRKARKRLVRCPRTKVLTLVERCTTCGAPVYSTPTTSRRKLFNVLERRGEPEDQPTLEPHPCVWKPKKSARKTTYTLA